MSKKILNLTGQVFERLKVIEFSHSTKEGDGKSKRFWKCLCECGNIVYPSTTNLRSGNSRSCGCYHKDKMKEQRVDLSNKNFGFWNVREFSHSTGRRTYWRCVCCCGNEHKIETSSLTRGLTKSCGCQIKGSNNFWWNGYGEMSGTYFSTLRHNAQVREIVFDITKEFVWFLFEKQNRKCALSGVELSFDTKNKSYDGSASLDRIDSSKGYVEGNVQWVHKTINNMKQNIEQDVFIEMCQRVAQNAKK